MKKYKMILVFMLFLLSAQYSLSSNISTLYDCPTMIDYNPSYADLEKSCKYANVFGLTKEQCYQNIKEMYAVPNNDYKLGKCKNKGHKVIEEQYKETQCSIQFRTKPHVKVYGYSYINNNGMSYNGGEDLEGAKCIDILYKELKSKYPDLTMSKNSI